MDTMNTMNTSSYTSATNRTSLTRLTLHFRSILKTHRANVRQRRSGKSLLVFVQSLTNAIFA